MAHVSLTTISAGQPALASTVMANYNAIVTQINGNLDSSNIADGSITGIKLADGAIGHRLIDHTVELQQLSANKSLVASDIGQALVANTSLTITIPDNLSDGFICMIIHNAPSGNVTFSADPGVTLINAEVGDALKRRGAGASLLHVGGNVFSLMGHLE